ncbi:MAG: CDP-diacylglycerol--serine O-phosphatidyltransferase [Alphaproteobacteria bacterium]|nr:CDP-diacylglycerol--serine O-phosphatidyltransferase [Alphaproteobacteria bacterium]
MEQPDRISRRKRARQIVAARLERLEDLSIGKLVPSTITLLALASGTTAIRFALNGQWKQAVGFVVAAMILDMLDGRAARLLGADSRFGAQLDSLADLVSFGVAPGVIMYMWSLERMGNAGWIAALIFCAASAVRLARFNVESVRDEGATKGNPYFTGLPTPAAACMMLLPLLLWFQWPGEMVRGPWFSAVMVAVTSALMVSRLPTPSIKYMKLQRQHRIAAGIVFAGLAALLVLWPWATLSVGLIIYVASIPFAVFAHHPRYATRAGN